MTTNRKQTDIFFGLIELELDAVMVMVFAKLEAEAKKVGYCNWSSSALTFTCGRYNLKNFSSILFKFVVHVTNE